MQTFDILKGQKIDNCFQVFLKDNISENEQADTLFKVILFSKMLYRYVVL